MDGAHSFLWQPKSRSLRIPRSMGWQVPAAGTCPLYAAISSSSVLHDFCFILVSARFGSADIVLDVVGRVNLDNIINGAHLDTRSNPLEQKENEGSFYSHAMHTALSRITDREGGTPSVKGVLGRILSEYPPGPNRHNIKEVLKGPTTSAHFVSKRPTRKRLEMASSMDVRF